MFFDHQWINTYLSEPLSPETMARLLNATGLETEWSDHGLEVEHTVNRPDAMCHFGLARELSIKTGIPLVPPEIDHRPIATLEGWPITSEDPEGCWTYWGLLIDRVHNTPSPQWLQDQLDRIQQTSHGLIVDLTNFLLWELGHPSHAFDADQLAGHAVRVRQGRPGETLMTLDGRTHDVNQLLCIADDEKPVALAGVMGGKASEVHKETRRLFLELAVFDPVRVRRAARQTHIQSDAKHRFERGVDETQMETVMRRFIFLLKEAQPEALVVGWRKFTCRPLSPKVLTIRHHKICQVADLPLEPERIQDLLQRMGFQPEALEGSWNITVPGYKVDVEREIDVIEELLRFIGLDEIPEKLPPMAGSDYQESPLQRWKRHACAIALNAGFQETLTYSFLHPEEETRVSPNGDLVVLRNPMTENASVLRRSLIPSLLQTAARNANYGQRQLRLFEVGKVFRGFHEPSLFCCFISEEGDRQHWSHTAPAQPFFLLKGILDALARVSLLTLDLHPEGFAGAHQNLAFLVKTQGQIVGRLAKLDNHLCSSLNLPEESYFLEIELDALPQGTPHLPRVDAPPTYPPVTRDMAFVVASDISYAQLQEALFSAKEPLLSALHCFDQYRGKSLPDGKKSIGFRFLFQSRDRTLTQEEVNEAMDRLVTRVREGFGAEIRS